MKKDGTNRTGLLVSMLIYGMLVVSGHAQSPIDGFDPNANNPVRAVAVQADGKIIIAGHFTNVGGQTRTRVARLNPDGSVDTTFSDPSVNGSVNAVAVQSDGKIIIGGSFTQVGSMPQSYIARLNTNGTVDTAFNPILDSIVYSVVIEPNGKILIGGFFTIVNSSTQTKVARLNTDGTLDTGFSNPNITGGVVFTMVLQSNGAVVIGGNFTQIGSATRNRIARLNSNGSLDGGFDPNSNGLVYSVALHADGRSSGRLVLADRRTNTPKYCKVRWGDRSSRFNTYVTRK